MLRLPFIRQQAQRPISPQSTSDWLARRLLSLPLLLLWLAALWLLRPRPEAVLSDSQARQATCLSNLGQIGLAFAQYAQDFNGKFPRGVDPEDRNNPEAWQGRALSSAGYGADDFSDDARTAPMLHLLLRPYTRKAEIWHCPSDNGWDASSYLALGGGMGKLQNVHPSSWDKFGTSYFYLTLRGFAGLRAIDMPDPAQAVSVFDGSLWHQRDREPVLSALYGDGHAGVLSKTEFSRATLKDQFQISAAIAAMRNSRLRNLQPRPKPIN